MEKGLIAWDIDGVIADILGHNKEKIHRRYGDRARFDQPIDYGLRGWMPADASREEVEDFFTSLYRDPETYRQLKPIDQWVELLNTVIRFELFGGFITRRPDHTSAATREFLHRHGLPSHPDGIVFCPIDEHKHSYFDAKGITCFVEDSPREALAIARAGHHSILVRTPYTEYEEAIIAHGGAVATTTSDALIYLLDRGYPLAPKGD